MTTEQEKKAIETIAKAARAFVASYDEFYPDYPEGISENLEFLIDSIDLLGDL